MAVSPRSAHRVEETLVAVGLTACSFRSPAATTRFNELSNDFMEFTPIAGGDDEAYVEHTAVASTRVSRLRDDGAMSGAP